MGLDAFGVGGSSPKKTSKKTTKTTKPKEEAKIEDQEEDQDSEGESTEKKTVVNSKRKAMKCTNSKCGYKRVIFKKELDDEDYVCPKCQGGMKLTK